MREPIEQLPRLRPCRPLDPPGTPLVRLDGAGKEMLELGRNRLVVAGMLFAVCFVILAGRLVDLTLLRGDGEPGRPQGHELAALVEPVPLVDRAPIVDRSGVLLATNLHTASLYADPHKVLDARHAAARLVRVLPDLSQADLQQKLSSDRSFVWIKRNLTPKQQDAVNRLGIPGLSFIDEQRRVYPQGPLAAHVLGFTDVDNKGIAGIEQFFDARLTDPARLGTPLMLSLDVRIQHALRDELIKAMATFQAIGAAGLVLDVHTGEVLAMVSLPDFDPTQAGDAPKDARFNRTTLGVYEMGSTFKTFTTAMALNAGTVTMTGGYDATRPIRVARFTISDDHPKKRWLSVPEIFIYSSNIGAAKMALDVGPEGQRAFLQRLGMLRKPALELPELGAPLLPRRWNTIETMTIAFGHGLSVSPLQLASGMAAVVNGGLMVPATLIKREPGAAIPAERVISATTSERMRRLLRLVVEEGTGKKAAAPGYLVGGKTGTAEKAGEGGYRRKALLSSFVGAFPMQEPRYLVVAMLDEPHGTKETYGFASGGWTAAPVVGRIVTRIAPVLGVGPVDEDAPQIRDAMTVTIPGQEKRLASF